MTFPLVTAAFTAYNASPTIAAALDSAIRQDWPNLEIVVVDDFSADDTADIIKAVIARNGANRSMRLLCQPQNLGVANARNRLLHEARGEFIAFFDDDDVSSPARVRSQFERISHAERVSGTDLILCHTARHQLFPNGRRQYEPTMGTGATLPRGAAVADRILIGRLSAGVVGSCATCSQMAKTSVYRHIGGFDSSIRRGEDTDFNIRFALAGGIFAGLSEPLVTQQMTGGGEKELATENASHVAVYEKYAPYLSSIGWLEFHRRWQQLRSASLAGKRYEAVEPFLRILLRHPIKLAQKVAWSLPARQTRVCYRRWKREAAVEVESAEQR